MNELIELLEELADLEDRKATRCGNGNSGAIHHEARAEAFEECAQLLRDHLEGDDE